MRRTAGWGLALLLVVHAGIVSAGEGDGPSVRGHPVSHWIQQLGADDAKARQAGIDALVEHGSGSVEPLLEALDGMTGSAQWSAAEVLRRLGDRAAPAVPTLLATLKTGTDDAKAAAAHALGGIARKDPAIIDTLADAVRGWRDYRFAAEALMKTGAPAMPKVVDLLLEGNRALQVRVLTFVLGQMGKEAMSATPALLLLRQCGDDEVRQAAEEVLNFLKPTKPQLVTEFTKALDHPNHSIKLLAIRHLGGYKADADPATKALARCLSDEDSVIREAAAMALAEIGGSAAEAVPALAEAARDPDTKSATAAVIALGVLGKNRREALMALVDCLGTPAPVGVSAEDALVAWGADAVPQLQQIVDGRNPAARVRAIRALGRIGPAAKDAVPRLVRAMFDDDLAVQTSASEALGRLGPTAVPALVDALKARDPAIRRRSAEALGSLGPVAAEAAAGLAKALRDRDPEVRAGAARALGRIGDGAKRTVSSLAKALRDKAAPVREEAAIALGNLVPRAAKASKALARALRDVDQNVQFAAADALGNIGDDGKDAVGALLWCLRNGPDEIQWRAARSLALIRPEAKHVIETLVDALRDEDWRVRKHAACALGALGAYARKALKHLEHLRSDSHDDVRTAVEEAIEAITTDSD
jgi:HEAT repeat protein